MRCPVVKFFENRLRYNKIRADYKITPFYVYMVYNAVTRLLLLLFFLTPRY